VRAAVAARAAARAVAQALRAVAEAQVAVPKFLLALKVLLAMMPQNFWVEFPLYQILPNVHYF
jgi:hypothetical protein